MFAPELKGQRVYHFTSKRRAFLEAFRFEPSQPTSLLYARDSLSGRFTLVGAMYTAPKGFSAERLDARIPLSMARWHQHVNWCVPQRGDWARWTERRAGRPVFGPESPIETRAACEAVRGQFVPNVFGWMVHVSLEGAAFEEHHSHAHEMMGH